MSVYAISDIHGCFDELRELLGLIGFSADDSLYVLGDLIDRGPKNPECIDLLVQSGSNVIFLMGNHESMMPESMGGNLSDFGQDSFSKGIWCGHGGAETFFQCKARCSAETMRAFQRILENVGTIASPESIPAAWVLVHAGLKPPC